MSGGELSEAQWERILPILPSDQRLAGRAGRPRVPNRVVLGGILWILRTGAPWKDLPETYGSYQTAHRRFQQWVEDGTLEEILLVLLADLEQRGGIDLSECFVDASFASAEKGVLELARQSAARGARSWQSRTARVFLSPYAVGVLRRTRSRCSRRRSGRSSPATTLSA